MWGITLTLRPSIPSMVTSLHNVCTCFSLKIVFVQISKCICKIIHLNWIVKSAGQQTIASLNIITTSTINIVYAHHHQYNHKHQQFTNPHGKMKSKNALVRVTPLNTAPVYYLLRPVYSRASKPFLLWLYQGQGAIFKAIVDNLKILNCPGWSHEIVQPKPILKGSFAPYGFDANLDGLQCADACQSLPL